jgi:dihydrodiol dehydrogenase / D-xylose 1-dehydrogenase (NADP)
VHTENERQREISQLREQLSHNCFLFSLFYSDVVYIGAINTAHLEIGLMMLDAGKHVLCEKPLTLNEKQSKQLLQRAKEKKLLCVEAIWSRFFPSYRHLKSRLDNNELGDIKEVEVEFGFALEHVDRLT